MKPTFLPLLVALAITASGCATVPDQPIVENGPVAAQGPVALGQPLWVGDVVVTPMRVLEDSRCPVDAQCIQAGRVIVETRIDGAGWRETMAVEAGTSKTTHGHIFTLTEVTPPRDAERDFDPGTYRFRYAPGP